MSREDMVREIVGRLVDYFHPERIYLIGSAARGEDRPGSDLDFLVLLPDESPRELLLSGREYERLVGIPVSVDVVPIRRSTFEARKDWLMSLPAIAVREGRVVYDVQPQAA